MKDNTLNIPSDVWAQALKTMNEDSRETLARRRFSPEKIDIFNASHTSLEALNEYRFLKNTEAERMLPGIINNPVQQVIIDSNPDEHATVQFSKPRHIGVVFSGGPAPGGHNVIAGLFDEMKRFNSASKMFGFIKGPEGLLENRYIEITAGLVDTHRNMGGFNMIKTGRTKIDSGSKMELALTVCKGLKLDALVIIGGDDSNTNAAFLAQHFKSSGIKVIGIPKTIDGDIQVKTENGKVLCATSFGFHSAARAFAQNISNLANDCSSDIKYWHVCKVMGRVASHLTLETALQTHVNIALIGEELADYVDQDRMTKAREQGEQIDYNAYGMTLRHLSRVICDIIVRRAAFGKNYGVMIIPEGILEFINEIQVFITKLNKIIADYNRIHDVDFHRTFPTLNDKLDYLRRISQGMMDKGRFPIWNIRDDELFNQLPRFFREGLLVERDLHGNFQFSQVKTEKIIMDMVKEYLDVLRERGLYKVGILRDEYVSLMDDAGMDPDLFAPALFKNPQDKYVLLKPDIISLKTLKSSLVNADMLDSEEETPQIFINIFKKSQAEFKTQTHFYGYDGRGTDPTYFDCCYAYNLGLTAFHLIAGGATGQMAAILNLEKEFDQWQPAGIPIARLMHLEERKGRLELVMEKSIVDLESNAFKVFQAIREDWVAACACPDRFRNPGAIGFSKEMEEDRPLTLRLNVLQTQE
ncbi:6-phosphofructokinase [uncultured Desulfobacter sp.]|uniref:6-phosphofructokinase n=1 Tax=uncultured Desulfobacter sp. TaxID=240139 RepID=UPI0029C87B7C|nr:6-phosphofructokinase [uncultured Desulfobacter sp.]